MQFHQYYLCNVQFLFPSLFSSLLMFPLSLSLSLVFFFFSFFFFALPSPLPAFSPVYLPCHFFGDFPHGAVDMLIRRAVIKGRK